MTTIPANWPFPIVNGVRTPESQALMDEKNPPPSNTQRQMQEDLANMEEALF